MLYVVEIFADDLPLEWAATGRTDFSRKLELTAHTNESRFYFKIFTTAEYKRRIANVICDDGLDDAADDYTYVVEYMDLTGQNGRHFVQILHCSTITDAYIEQYLYWREWLNRGKLAVFVGDKDRAIHFKNSTTGYEEPK